MTDIVKLFTINSKDNMNDNEHEQIGKACKHCGHTAGAHEALAGEDLDEPEREAGCRHGEGCLCTGFID